MADMLHDFGVNKVERLQRSRWSFPVDVKTNFRQGALVPLGWVPVIPSSTISMDFSSLTRLALTMTRPVMGDMYFSYGAYFVPYRILFKNYEEMFGDGKPSEWSDPTEYVLPTAPFVGYGNITPYSTSGMTGYDAVVPLSGSVNSGGYIFGKPCNLASYLGLPNTTSNTNPSNIQYIDVAPFAAYERIWSDFWRDENYQNVDPDLEKVFELTPGTAAQRTTLKFCLHYANRFHDYMTSLLPDTQKGVASASQIGELITLPTPYNFVTATGNNPYIGDNATASASTAGYIVNSSSKVTSILSGTASTSNTLKYTNIGVDLSIDSLRSAMALKRAQERNARTGSRFVEAMLGTFEAHLPNEVAQRAVYLGGNTIQLNKTSVPSTNGDSENGNLGSLGAYSVTGGNQKVFVQTFNEPGIVMIVGTVRIKHSYQRGLSRFWQKTRRYDMYDPAFAHISEQPIYLKELSLNSDDSADDVLGFQEPWCEYKKPISLITGNLKYADGQADINAWTWQDQWSDGTVLNPQVYYPENGNEIANSCGDYNSSYPDWQFIGHYISNFTITAPMPLYSIPGFIDHLIA